MLAVPPRPRVLPSVQVGSERMLAVPPRPRVLPSVQVGSERMLAVDRAAMATHLASARRKTTHGAGAVTYSRTTNYAACDDRPRDRGCGPAHDSDSDCD